MRKYETIFISDPDLQDQARSELFEKVRNIITRENGILLNFDEWGNKKLAYEIKKKVRGHYVCLTYGGTGALVTELERNFRLSDDVMKFMTILISDEVTEEELAQEAQAVAETEQADQAAEDAKEPEVQSEDTPEKEATAKTQDTEAEEVKAPEETEDAETEQN